MAELFVYWNTRQVGRLTTDGRRDMIFQYEPDYLAHPNARAISLSLPLQGDAFAPELSRAWFANLLPEGDVRGHVARRLGVSERNDFELLAGIGDECAGALRLLPAGRDPQTQGGYRPLLWDDLEAAIATSPRPSLLALMTDGDQLRLSLAGAQDKLPVLCENGVLSLPTGGAASSHLLKIGGGGLIDLVQNELFCLRLAQEVDLPVVKVDLAPTCTPMLLVTRYDRYAQENGHIDRLHQEDFCQALGLPPETKYEAEGGPSLEDLFAVLNRGSKRPLPDRRDLLRWVLLNTIIGNADAHAKNLSLVQEAGDGTLRLAPVYDLVCTAVYPSLTRKTAQKIGGEYRNRAIESRHWRRFADAVGIKFAYLQTEAISLGDRVERAARPLAEQIAERCGGESTLAMISGIISENLHRLRRTMTER